MIAVDNLIPFWQTKDMVLTLCNHTEHIRLLPWDNNDICTHAYHILHQSVLDWIKYVNGTKRPNEFHSYMICKAGHTFEIRNR